MSERTGAIPNWRLEGDWFDLCSCSIGCPLRVRRAQRREPRGRDTFLAPASGSAAVAGGATLIAPAPF